MDKIRKAKNMFKYRLTGISFPFGGISWEKKKSERDYVKELLSFLEDRRVLYVPCEAEVPRYAYESVQEIRKFLTQYMINVGEKSYIYPHLKALRAECVRTIIALEKDGGWIISGNGLGNAIHLNSELGRLRGIFGVQLAILCNDLDVDISENLVTILPANTESEELEGTDE
ncbi:MAG: DUF6650 family protein [Deferribacterales bacterium]